MMRTLSFILCLFPFIQVDAQKRINYFSDYLTIDWSGNTCYYALVYKSDSNVRMDFYNCNRKKVKTECFEKGFRPLKDDRELFRQGEQLLYFSNGVISKRVYVTKAVPRNAEESSYDSTGRFICTGTLLNDERQQGGFMDKLYNGQDRIEYYEKELLTTVILLNPGGDTANMYKYHPLFPNKLQYTYMYDRGKLSVKKLHTLAGPGLDSIVETRDTFTNQFRVTYHVDYTAADEKVFVSADRMAKFKTGEAEFSRFIQQNILYPNDARDMGIEGKVIVKFVVETDGSVSHVEALGQNHPSLEKEAISVIQKTSGMWFPASHNGMPVRMLWQIPIVFKLQ
jgi:TonB family protein